MVPMVPESMMVFAGNANPKLAQAVTEYLHIPLGRASVARFSDGEVSVQLLIRSAARTSSFCRAPVLRRTTI